MFSCCLGKNIRKRRESQYPHNCSPGRTSGGRADCDTRSGHFFADGFGNQSLERAGGREPVLGWGTDNPGAYRRAILDGSTRTAPPHFWPALRLGPQPHRRGAGREDRTLDATAAGFPLQARPILANRPLEHAAAECRPEGRGFEDPDESHTRLRITLPSSRVSLVCGLRLSPLLLLAGHRVCFTPLRDVAGVGHSGGNAEAGQHPLHHDDVGRQAKDGYQPFGHLLFETQKPTGR